MIKTISFVFSCLLVAQSVPAQTNEAAAKRVDSLFASYTTATPGAAVVIVKNGKIIFKKGYGMADLAHNIPVTPQTVFNIASVSKQFTAFAIYLLEGEGKLSFEDDVRRYIPELPGYGATIKIKHLLAHTSGLRDQEALFSLAGGRPGDIFNTEHILKLVTRQKSLNFTPGSMYGYCNTGYTLLAEIVHRVSGKTFAAYAHDHIFKPLGMTSTRVCDNHEAIIKNKAESYELVNNVYYHKPLNASVAGPSNILTTAEDLAKWVMNFDKPVVGNNDLVKAFNEPSYLDNGNKVFLRLNSDGDSIFHAKGQNLSRYKGVQMITHGGHTAAFRTFLGRFPGQHFSVIALSNDEHNENLRARWQIADFYIKDDLLPKKTTGAPTPPATAKTTAAYTTGLKEFEGEYYSDELSTSYTLEARGNKLIMTHLRLSNVELNQVGESKFSGSGNEVFPFELEFFKNNGQVVDGFMVSNFGVKNLKFVKVK